MPLAEAIKEVVDIPVIVAGGITEPEFADKLIRVGKVDLVAVGRAQQRSEGGGFSKRGSRSSQWSYVQLNHGEKNAIM